MVDCTSYTLFSSEQFLHTDKTPQGDGQEDKESGIQVEVDNKTG